MPNNSLEGKDMRILIIGGRGFIGRHIAAACEREGHQALIAARRAAGGNVACDLDRDKDCGSWSARLDGIDAVINCAGLLHGTPAQLQAVHCDAPAAIAMACANAKIPFLHISVLGLDRAPDTAYFRSKRNGESAIRSANSAAIIVRPSLVFGKDSPATQLMLLQSRLPVFVLPVETQPIAPIHVDDLAHLCLCLVGTMRAYGCDVDCVGSDEMSIADYMQALRGARRSRRAHILAVPNRWMRLALSAAAYCGAKMLRPEALDLMEHAHTGNRRTFARWMHRMPRPVGVFEVA